MRWNKLYISVSCTRLAEEYYSKEQALCSSFQSKNNLVLGKVWVSMWLPYTHVYCDYVSALFIQYDFNAMQYMWTDNGNGITLDTHNCSERDWSIHAFDTSYLPWSEQTSILEIKLCYMIIFATVVCFKTREPCRNGSMEVHKHWTNNCQGQWVNNCTTRTRWSRYAV